MSIKIAIVSQFDQKGIKDAEKGLQSLSAINDKVFKAVAGAAALAAVGIGKFAADSITAASNLAESTNAVNVAFGKSAQAVLAIGENSAESLGLAQNEFNQAAVRFSAFADRIAGEGGDTAKVIQTLTQRAADFASVFNIEVSEALRVFQSGLAGEAEPLKRFGINLLQSEVQAYALANGIAEVGSQMTETEKVQARFGLLLQETAKTAGDFANTSDGLANSQRILKAQFEDLQAEVGTALLPAFTELVKAVGDQLMPRLEELGEFLNSPEGKKIIEETANTVLDLAERFIELIPTLVKVGGGILGLTTAIKILEGAFGAARLAAQLFSTTIAVTSPILGLIALVGTLTLGFVALHESQKQARETATGLTGRQAELRAELARNKELLDANVIKYQEYQDAIGPVVRELSTLEGHLGATTGEFNRFNNMSFGNLKGELRGVSAEIMAMYHSGVAASAAFEGIIDPRTGRGVDFTIPAPRTATGMPPSTGGSGPSAAEVAAEQLEKVQGIIKRASDSMWSAQRDYQQRVTSAQTAFQKRSAEIADAFTEDVVRATEKRNSELEDAFQSHVEAMVNIEAQANQKLAEIISRSKNSLRDAYRTATELSISEVLSDFNRAEDARRKAFEDSRQEAERNKEAFNEAFTAGDPVAALRDTLAAQVAANKRLADQSAALFAAGFSQTFIEQMIQAGDEGSMVVADALLGAAPETRASIQQLFGEIENQSQTGLDALADQIFETAGLATKELRDLYALTEAELIISLEAQRVAYEQQVQQIQATYQSTLVAVTNARNAAMGAAHAALVEEMREAENALRTALDAIEKEFRESIAALDGNLSGLGRTIDALLAKFGQLKTAAGQSTAQVVAAPPKPASVPTPAPVTGALAGFTQVGTLTGQAINQATGILIDSASDLQKIMVYLAERINAAQRFASLEAKTPEEAANARMMATLFAEQASTVNALAARPDKGVGTVININVKADTSQSLAMVGRSLGNTVAKYVTGGGQVIVSPV